MLYGDTMFLSTTLLKFHGAINGHYSLDSLEIFFREVTILGKSQCFYGSPYGIKELKNDEMFMSTILLKHASPVRCVL